MKLSTLFSMLLATTLLLSACGDGNDSAAETQKVDFDAMAQELCTCMSPLSDLYKQVMAASAAQDTTKMSALVGDFERLSQEGEACASRLEQKYGAMDDPAIMEKARTAVEKACPDIAAMMAGANQ